MNRWARIYAGGIWALLTAASVLGQLPGPVDPAVAAPPVAADPAMPAATQPASPPDRVVLTSGDVLHGRVIERDADRLVLEHADLGRLTIASERIQRLDRHVAGPVEAAAIAPQVTEPTVLPPAAGTTIESAPSAVVASSPMPGEQASEPPPRPSAWWRKLLTTWDSRLAVRFDGRDADRSQTDLRVDLETERRREEDRWKFDLSHRVRDRDDELTRSRLAAGGLYESYVVDSPWSLQSRARYEYDEFRDWDYRVTADVSAGYELVDVKKLRVIGRFGGGVLGEFGPVKDGYQPEGLLGLDAFVRLNGGQQVTASILYLPSVIEGHDYRLLTTAAWQVKLQQADGLSLRIGVENEYESLPGDGGTRNDLRYYGAMVFEF